MTYFFFLKNLCLSMFIYMYEFMHTKCVPGSMEVRSLGTGVMDGYELPCGYYKMNLGL